MGASREQIKNFIDYLSPKVISICKRKQKKILPSVCIAQACLESGYGTAEKMTKANALFGIKVGSKEIRYGTAWKGNSYDTKTHEFYDGKTKVKISAFFRAYNTIEESIEDYYDLMGNNSRFVSAIGEADYERCITAICNGGYATDPSYRTNIVKIIEKNELTKYDEGIYISSYKYRIGDTIDVTSYYKNCVDDITKVINKNSTGTIIRIKPGTRNPYCFGIGKSPIGWCNDNNIYSGNSFSNDMYEYHTVKFGDTLSKIAKTYNTTVDKILEMNIVTYTKMTKNYILPGWKLRVK